MIAEKCEGATTAPQLLKDELEAATLQLLPSLRHHLSS